MLIRTQDRPIAKHIRPIVGASTSRQDQPNQLGLTLPRAVSNRQWVWCSEWKLETTPITPHAHKVIRMNNAKNLTIGAFFELIKASGYDKYQFTNNGNGCRYWVFSVVKLLEEMGYLVKADEAKTALNTVWSDGKPITSGIQTPLDKQKGTFYR